MRHAITVMDCEGQSKDAEQLSYLEYCCYPGQGPFEISVFHFIPAQLFHAVDKYSCLSVTSVTAGCWVLKKKT